MNARLRLSEVSIGEGEVVAVEREGEQLFVLLEVYCDNGDFARSERFQLPANAAVISRFRQALDQAEQQLNWRYFVK